MNPRMVCFCQLVAAMISSRLAPPFLLISAMTLGHSDQNITLSIYSHALTADSNAAAKVWGDAMKDVIAEARKPAPARMLAVVSRKAG